MRVLEAPIAGTIPAAAAVRVAVSWPGATDVALVTDGKWTKLRRTGETFAGEVVAAGSSLSVVGRTSGRAGYETLLHYRVAAERPGASTK